MAAEARVASAKGTVRRDDVTTSRSDLLRGDGSSANLLGRVFAALQQALDLTTILDMVLQELMTVAGAQAGAIYLTDASAERAELIGQQPPQSASPPLRQVVLTPAYQKELWSHRQAAIVEPGGLPEPIFSLLDRVDASGSVLFCPVWGGERLLAFAILGHRQPGAFEAQGRQLATSICNVVAPLLEKAAVHEHAQWDKQQLAFLCDAAKELNQSLELDSLAIRLTGIIVESTGTDRVGLALLDERGKVIYRRLLGHYASAELAEEAVQSALTNGLAGQALRERRGMIREPNGIDSLMAIPLLLPQRVVGVLTLYKASPNYYTQRHLDLVTALANQAASVIENARLYGLERRRAHEMEALNALAARLSRSRELDQVLDIVLSDMQKALDFRNGCVFLLEGDPPTLQLSRYCNMSPEAVERIQRRKVGKGFLGRIITRGRAAFFVNSSLRLAEKLGARTIVAIPLRAEGDVVGVLVMGTPTPQALDEETLAWLQAVGDVSGVAIANARLYGALEQRVAERTAELRRRATELEALNQIGMVLTSSLEMRAVLQAVLEHTLRILDLPVGGIYLLDEDAQMLRITVWHGARTPAYEVIGAIPLGEGLAGRVAISGQPHVMLTEEYPNEAGRKALRKEGIILSVSVPLLARGRIVGAINVASRETGEITDRELELLSTIGSQVGPYVANARLFSELQAAHERLRALSAQLANTLEKERAHLARELHDEIGQALTALKLGLQMSREELVAGNPRLQESLNDNIQLVNRTLERVRSLAIGLRSPDLEQLGLIPALRSQIHEFMRRTGVHVQLYAREADLPFSAEAALALYRIAQEALTNVARHAQASNVLVQILRTSKGARLLIRDDGVGFDVQTEMEKGVSSGHLGLAGIAERVALLSGELQIESGHGEGTCLIVDIPIHTAWRKKGETDTRTSGG